MIPISTIDEIRNKTDILPVISEYVPLKKRGKNYIGLCPFHSEKTPSFTVSPDKQIFHCFGCSEGGNVFAFLMKAENISFAEAVQMLGEKLGIVVKSTGTALGPSSDKDKYFSIMELANRFYIDNLAADKNGIASKYLEDRGVSDSAAKAFGLGYASESWDALYNHLFKKGVSQNDMAKLGLIIERNDKSGYYDRFRGRLMFPVFNLRNRIIGFSGRILKQSSEEEAKYINSPDSPIYNKGYSLYGINVTKDEIKKTRTAVLVEGNVDLISCWQYGIKNVIAPLGTALTQNQAKIIRRFADKVIIAFDSDNAGDAATGRSVEILKEEGLAVHVAKYEGGKDPDEALRKKGADSFITSLNEAMPWMEYKILSTMSKFNLKEIEARAKAAKEAAAIIAQEKEPLIQNEYIKLIAAKLGFNFDEIASEVNKLGFYRKGSAPSLKRTVEKPASKMDKAEECLIRLAIENKDIFEMFKTSIKWDEFTGPTTRTIAEVIQSIDFNSNESISHKVLEELPDEDSKKVFSKILMSEYPESNIDKVAKDCVNTIKAHHLRSRMDKIRGEMASAEKEGQIENVSILHKEFKDANDALRSLSF